MSRGFKFVLFFLGVMIAASMVSEQLAMIVAVLILIGQLVFNAEALKEKLGKVWI